jgi:outer membrane lipoprotein
MNYIRYAVVPIALSLLAGCATVPEPLEGDYSESFYPEQATSGSVGARVRWGGRVVETRPGEKRTCIELLARELDSSARPRETDRGQGRFLACRGEFIDPEIFTNGREVTVVGRLRGFRDGSVGEFQYEYPVVDADSVYLWPERVDPYIYDRGWYYHGWGWGYPSYWPNYYRAPYFHSRVIYYPRSSVRRSSDGANAEG